MRHLGLILLRKNILHDVALLLEVSSNRHTSVGNVVGCFSGVHHRFTLIMLMKMSTWLMMDVMLKCSSFLDNRLIASEFSFVRRFVKDFMSVHCRYLLTYNLIAPEISLLLYHFKVTKT